MSKCAIECWRYVSCESALSPSLRKIYPSNSVQCELPICDRYCHPCAGGTGPEIAGRRLSLIVILVTIVKLSYQFL
jgi:hypothetical protein